MNGLAKSKKVRDTILCRSSYPAPLGFFFPTTPFLHTRQTNSLLLQLHHTFASPLPTSEIGQTKLNLWVRFRFTYARRRAAPDQPAPPLPTPPPKSEASQDNSPPVKYPYITYFKTAEEAARNVDRRREANPPYPESECERAWFLKQMQTTPEDATGQTTE